jgi:peptide-methionine (R)-S-oxide reductase
MKKAILAIAILTIITAFGCQNSSGQPKRKLSKPAAEWKKTLTPNQYYIMVESGTEPPYKNDYWNNHEKGIYVSAATGEVLFSSEDKFDSCTGLHLGHVFDVGPADRGGKRFCMNSGALKFIKK